MLHFEEEATKKTAYSLGWDLTGSPTPCMDCAATKAKQKAVPKETKDPPLKDGDIRAYLDISSLKQKVGMPTVTKPHWRMIVVDKTVQLKLSDFYAKKSDMVEPTCEKIHKWISQGNKLTNLRMDNAGENTALAKGMLSKDWPALAKIKVEFTARDTPQQNSIAERGLASMTDRGRAMIIAANVPYKIRFKIWRWAMKTATLLDGLMVVEVNNKSLTRYEHLIGEIPAFASQLRTWGEAGTVKIKTKTCLLYTSDAADE